MIDGVEDEMMLGDGARRVRTAPGRENLSSLGATGPVARVFSGRGETCGSRRRTAPLVVE
jgi:hypothetical protein